MTQTHVPFEVVPVPPPAAPVVREAPVPNPYRFIKVDEFFADALTWNTLSKVDDASWDANRRRLSLEFTASDGTNCLMVLELPCNDVIRVRFNPAKSRQEDYSDNNSRLVVMDSFELLGNYLWDPATHLAFSKTAASADLVIGDGQAAHVRLHVAFSPFAVTISRTVYDDREQRLVTYPVMADAVIAYCLSQERTESGHLGQGQLLRYSGQDQAFHGPVYGFWRARRRPTLQGRRPGDVLQLRQLPLPQGVRPWSP